MCAKKGRSAYHLPALFSSDEELPGFIPVQQAHEWLFDVLYSAQSAVLYNHSRIIPYSYLNTGQMRLFINKDAEPGNIIPVVKKFKNTPCYFIHCPDASYERILETVALLQGRSNKPVYIQDVTEEYASKFLENIPGWKKRKTSDDVIYDAQLIHNLTGTKFSSIRNTLKKVRINLMPELYPITTEERATHAIYVFDQWKLTQGTKYFRATVGRDKRLIETYWDKVDNIHHFAFIAYVGGQPAAVSYGCRSYGRADWGVEVTLKALTSYYGLSDYMRQHLISTMYGAGIRYINDSDLNYSPGVRINKLKWKPVEFIRTFNLEEDKK